MLQKVSIHIPAASVQPYIAISNPSLHLPKHTHYDGDPKACQEFLNHFTIHFEVLAHQFASENAKVAFIAYHLSGEA